MLDPLLQLAEELELETLPAPATVGNAITEIRAELDAGRSTRGRRIGEAVVMAALSTIPWVGGFLAAAAAFPGGEASSRADELRTEWLKEHERKLQELYETLRALNERLEALGPGIEERLQSEEYLGLVRQAFRTWDEAETAEKRRYVGNLLANCAGTRVCSDDVVRMFITWLNEYHESHFVVIREVHQNPGSTRYGIWTEIYGPLPREDSAEADLYKMLIRDLNLGGVLRQVRDVNEVGEFVRKKPPKRRGPTPTTMESAFEDTKGYVLTDLGQQFVHYTMNEVITRLSA